LEGLPPEVSEKILANVNKKGTNVQEALAGVDPFLKAKYLRTIQQATGVPNPRRNFMDIRKNIKDVDVANDLMIKLYNQNLHRIPEGGIPWVDEIEDQYDRLTGAQKIWSDYRTAKDVDPFNPIADKALFGTPSRLLGLQRLIPDRIRPNALDETIEQIRQQARHANERFDAA
jgi:hypothetical protein